MVGLSTALGLAAPAVYLGRLLPQPVRTLRKGVVEGVSPLASMNSLVADGAWLAYGLANGVVPVWAVAIPSIAASAWTTWLLRRSIRPMDRAWASGWLAVVVACGAARALPLALAATVLVTCGPQLVAAFASPSPTGLSTATWWLALLDAATWGGYGVVIHNDALDLYAVVLALTAATLLLRFRAVVPDLPTRQGAET